MNIKKNKVGWDVVDYKEYTMELERALQRQQWRAREHRRNLKGMQRKLERFNLIEQVQIESRKRLALENAKTPQFLIMASGARRIERV